eukprot:1771251-Amphidinium_carterae.1
MGYIDRLRKPPPVPSLAGGRARGHNMGCPFVHPSHSVICFINDYEEQPPLWACQHCGKYGQRRWGGPCPHLHLIPPSVAGRNALAKLWAGQHPANRSQ